MNANSREGWIEWAGGETDEAPVTGQIEWKNRQGSQAVYHDATQVKGWRKGHRDQIIAYRVVTAADDRGDGYESPSGVVSPNSPDELAMAVELLKGLAGCDPLGISGIKALRLILSRLASQEETIRADGEALTEARAFVDRYSDMNDGDYGGQEPNEAMQIVHAIDQALGDDRK